MIREVHVYGRALALKSKDAKVQHKGIGKQLLKMAEDVTKHYNNDKVVVISGVGVKEYYKNQGYSKEGPYMVKNL